MNKLMPCLLLVLTTSVFGDAGFYECEGFAGVEEYGSAIDLQTKQADFFDNSVTSLLTQVKLQTKDGEVIVLFEGEDLNGAGNLKLSFNQTKLGASLSTVINGKSRLLSRAKCKEDVAE